MNKTYTLRKDGIVVATRKSFASAAKATTMQMIWTKPWTLDRTFKVGDVYTATADGNTYTITIG
jgi:hypothetical protein